MATIGGLSGGTSSSVSMYGTSMKGYGGLASGLDTDSLIQGMTQGTRTKIQEALKKKDKYQWQMDSYRSISDKLVSFNKKYLDISNSSSPYRASFFDKSLATAHGTNSKSFSVSGTSNTLESMSVQGIKQLAKDTSLVTSKNGSIQELNTGDINFDTTMVSTLNGGNISVKYGDHTYNLNFTEGSKVTYRDGGTGDYKETTLDFSTAEKTKDSINALMNSANLLNADGKTVDASGNPTTDPEHMVKLGSKISFGVDPDTVPKEDRRFSLAYKDPSDTTQFNIAGGNEDTLKTLGFMDSDDKLVNSGVVDPINGLKGVTEATTDKITTKREFNEFMAGKQITFTYNGVTRSIKMPEKTDADYGKLNKNDFGAYLEGKLDSAFGAGKIKVASSPIDADGKRSLSFTTSDPSSTLKISDADAGIMGKTGILGVGYATTNRLNREDTLANSGLAGLPAGFGTYTIDATTGAKMYTDNVLHDEKGNLKIEINGKKVEGLTVNSSVMQITSAINASDAGVKINYSETADRFSMSATNHGEAGKIAFGAEGSTGGPTDFLKTLFGAGAGSGVVTDGTDYKKTSGQDAIMTVKYEGNVEMDIKRDSNSFNLDGSTFTLTSTFGYKAMTNPDGTPGFEVDSATAGEVTFTAAVDTDKVSKVIKEMIDDYNAVLEEAFKKVSTKPNRDYSPLTDDQKSQLKSDEIEKLETKAKEGILFNDPLIRSLSDSLRSVFSGTTDTGTLANMGIVLSGDYAANGKIGFDEQKFKDALAENPDKVKELFTKPAVKDASGSVTDPGGFSVRLKAITESFAKTSGIPKGSLIEKAGSTSSPTSVLQNSLKTQMDEIDDQVKRFKVKLQTEIDRYTKQFSSLEQLISQMNSQSSWLSQATGG